MRRCLFAQLRGRLHDHGVAIAEIERAAIQRAEFRAQFGNVEQALNGADEIGARTPFHRRFAGADIKIAAHAGGQVDDDFLVLGADALHDFPVEINAAGTLAGLGVADMAMDHGGTGSGGFQRGIGNLLGGYGNIRAFANRVASAGHGAGNDDLGVHGSPPFGREVKPAPYFQV